MSTKSNDTSPQNDKQEETAALLEKMKATKAQWDAEAASAPDGPDETDALLSQAISMAIEQGKGWAPGEREKYLETLLDDDFIPPLFASTKEELEHSGLAEAFSTLYNEGEVPAKNMLDFRKKGNASVALGRKNVAKNLSVGTRIFSCLIPSFVDGKIWGTALLYLGLFDSIVFRGRR